MSRYWPIGMAILVLRGAIINHEEQNTEQSLKRLKQSRWKAGRCLSPFRKSKIRHIFLIDYLKSLNIEIERARKLIWKN